MPAAAFIPLIAQGVGMWAGGKAAKKAQAAAAQRSPEEIAAIQGGMGVGDQASKAASEAIGASKPYMKQAGNYYSTLLRGNRAQMSQAVSPYAAQIGQNFAGANRGLEQMGVRGAARDVARADLNRQRAQQISGLTTGMQPAAAEALGRLGISGMQTAAPLYGTAGNVYSNVLAQGLPNRKFAAEEGGKAGAAIGGLVRDIGETIHNTGEDKGWWGGESRAPKGQGWGVLKVGD
jgi:hypothetical protein